MRKKMVAGNWKMNKTLEEGKLLAKELADSVSKIKEIKGEVVVCPPFILLESVAAITKNSGIKTGAQNCASETVGAYTGEISAKMIASTGAEYVIIGHSERRSYQKEDDALLLRKTQLAMEAGLKPIFCCGELLPEREAGKQFEVVKNQLENGLFPLSKELFQNIIIAYEPVWAIGTGVNATPEQAQEMHAYLRKLIREKYDKTIADDCTILYGGSCNAQNAATLFSRQDVDGGLIGGASIKCEDFISIIQSL